MSNYLSPKKALATNETPDGPTLVPEPRKVKLVQFVGHARCKKRGASAVREVSAALATIEEDDRDRGIWIDGYVFVPWSNIYFIEYA